MDRRLLAWAYASRRPAIEASLASGCSPMRGVCPIRVRRRRACRVAWRAWCCAMTASRGVRRSGAIWRGSAGRGASLWWWPAMSGWPRRSARVCTCVPAAGRRPPPPRPDYQFRPWTGRPAARPSRRRLPRLSLPGIPDREPPRRRRPRPGPLDPPGAIGAGLPVAALGGIDGASVRRLPRRDCTAAGAIGALA